MNAHNWSGWPGAWCLDCGIEDPIEIALADGAYDIDDDGDMTIDAILEPCTEPGSNRHNPYFHPTRVQ